MKFTWRNLLCFIGIHTHGIIHHDAESVYWECSNCLWKARSKPFEN